MITEKASIIFDDKNIRYALISKVINIVIDKYNNNFNIQDLTFLNEFTFNEKKYLRKIFSRDITKLYAWEHNFYFWGNMWHYDESDQYDYQVTIRQIMLLLNKSKIAIGDEIKTTDYHFIKDIFDTWFSLLDSETQRLYGINFNEKEFVIFISHNLRDRIGEACIYNFEFLKTFMEAKKDYHAKKLVDAIFGIKTIQSF